jgi:hypothetical protein
MKMDAGLSHRFAATLSAPAVLLLIATSAFAYAQGHGGGRAAMPGTTATAQNQPPAQTGQAAGQSAPVSPEVNALAHHILECGMKINALAGGDMKPWHLKAQFTLWGYDATQKPKTGTMEEWYTSRYQWRRTYSSSEQEYSGWEMSLSRFERYRSKSRGGFNPSTMNERVGRPVVDPLYLAGNIKPDYELDGKRFSPAGTVLNCVSVVNPWRYADQSNPDLQFPNMCFDNDMHLQLESTNDNVVQFGDLQPFQDHFVARDVKILQHGTLTSEIKVTVLEPLAAPDAGLTKPGKDGVLEPYHIEPGMPWPESTYEVGASIPVPTVGSTYNGSAVYTGMAFMPVVIKKDGTVKADLEFANAPNEEVRDAIEHAVNKWKYKPYLVDGQPIEVGITIAYVLGDKKFVPSYEKAKAAAATH